MDCCSVGKCVVVVVEIDVGDDCCDFESDDVVGIGYVVGCVEDCVEIEVDDVVVGVVDCWCVW